MRADQVLCPGRFRRVGGAAQSRARDGQMSSRGLAGTWSWRGGTRGEALHSRAAWGRCSRKPASSVLSPVVEKVKECWARWCLLRGGGNSSVVSFGASVRGMWDLPGPGLNSVSPALAAAGSYHCTTRKVHTGLLTLRFTVFITLSCPLHLFCTFSQCDDVIRK